MPWVPVKHALRKLREGRGWSLQDLEDEANVSITSIAKIESRTPPSFVKPHNAEAISLAFGLKLRDYNDWPPAARWIVWRPTRGGRERDEDVPQLGAVDTLSKSAKIERSRNLHAATLQTSDGPIDLLGLDRLDKIFSMTKSHHGQCFAVVGTVAEHMPMPSSAARRIGADEEGVIFRVTRAVARNLPIYVTVYSPSGEISRQLMAAYDSGERIAVRARVHYDPYEGSWRGFFFIEPPPPKAKKFAIVVEKIVSEIK